MSEHVEVKINPEDWLSVRQFSKRLGMTKAGVRLAIRGGRIEAYRIDCHTLIPASEAERFKLHKHPKRPRVVEGGQDVTG